MTLVELLPQFMDLFTSVLVNKVMRGNAMVLMPSIVFAAVMGYLFVEYRRRIWLSLPAEEQIRLQMKANAEGQWNKMYPLE